MVDPFLPCWWRVSPVRSEIAATVSADYRGVQQYGSTPRSPLSPVLGIVSSPLAAVSTLSLNVQLEAGSHQLRRAKKTEYENPTMAEILKSPAPPSDGKGTVCGDDDVLLSAGSSTPREVYDAAEERHLLELARQFSEPPTPPAGLASPAAASPRVTSPGPDPSEDEVPTSSAPLRDGAGQEGDERSVDDTLSPSRVTPITVQLIKEPVKVEPPAAVPVTSLASTVWASVTSLFGAPVLVTAGPKPAGETHEIVPQLQNIVSTMNLCCTLDLRKMALQARNAEYNPRRFAAVIMRIREPRTTALLFRSGKVVCTGARSELQSRIAARKFARIAQKLGYDAKFTDFKIQNIVASCDVGFCIKLESLALNHSQFSCYEPELFPGLVYRMVQPCILLLVFVSGKVVLTGAKVREDIYKAFNNIHPILKKYRST